ncbi:MAG: methyltransferase [Deltaproteobacteria bacterium]|nr:methyltransferase [Deltaproteobacteria bacterium]
MSTLTLHAASSPKAPSIPKAPPTGVVRFAQRLQRALGSLARRMSPPPFALLDLVMSRWVGDALAAITELGVPDRLAAGPRDCEALASELGLHAPSLYRVLRALARSGLLVEGPSRSFALTETTRALCTDHPHSMRNMVLEVLRPRNTEVWSRLPESLRTGASAWGKVHDVDLWTWLEQHPEEHGIFHGAMVELTREAAPAYAWALDYPSFGTVCDLGGGEGQLLATILAAHPTARGVLVDAPRVLEGAPAVLARYGVRERCELVPGDVFSSAPKGHGLYLAKNILHGLSDELGLRALRAWREAMPPGGALAVIDVVVPATEGPYLQWLDLQMLLASHGGRERTRDEFAGLFASAGLRLERVIETPTPLDLLLARRAD